MLTMTTAIVSFGIACLHGLRTRFIESEKVKELLEISAGVVKYGAFVCAVLVHALLWARPLLVRRFSRQTGPPAASS